MERRNLLKGLLGLPLLRLREAKKLPEAKLAKSANEQVVTAFSFTVEEWAAPQHERDALELEIQTLRKNRKK